MTDTATKCIVCNRGIPESRKLTENPNYCSGRCERRDLDDELLEIRFGEGSAFRGGILAEDDDI